MSFIGKQTNYLDFGAVKINKFPKPIPCTTNALFCQPTIQDDDIAFQFEASESEELLVNGDFAQGITGWNNVGWAFIGVSSQTDPNKHACLLTTTNINGISQAGILTLGDFYKVTLTVRNRTTGLLQAGQGTGTGLSNNALLSTENGTFIVFFAATGTGTDFVIKGTAGFDGCVDDVSVIKISDTSDYTIQIHDQQTLALIDTVPAANLRQEKNVITVDFNWADDVTVSNGCRVIRVFDNTNIFEDNFATDQGWRLQADITISGGGMSFLSTGIPRSASIGGIFTPGESYEITYDVTITGTGTSQVKCGKTAGTVRSVNGTFVETLLCTFNDTLFFAFTGAAASTVDIDNIFIKKANNLDGQSECYDLETSQDCTLLLRWSNDERWGGFDYSQPLTGDAFENRLRITAKFRGSKYPGIRIIGEDSAGGKSLDYTTLRKSPILDVDFAPDYIHDGIAAMFSQDTRLIDDVSFILIDEYEPSAPNDSRAIFKDLMTSRSELELTVQENLINRNE